MQKDELGHSEPYERSVVMWNYDGREVPIEVIWPTGAEEDRLLEALAEFVWKHQHLAKEYER